MGMTHEEAIKVFDGLLNAFNESEHGDFFYDYGEAVCQAASVAIAALREQEERSKGCVWCYPNKLCGTCLHNVDYHEDGTDKCSATLYEVPCSHYKSFPFCPMCGRRLEDA